MLRQLFALVALSFVNADNRKSGSKTGGVPLKPLGLEGTIPPRFIDVLRSPLSPTDLHRIQQASGFSSCFGSFRGPFELPRVGRVYIDACNQPVKEEYLKWLRLILQPIVAPTEPLKTVETARRRPQNDVAGSLELSSEVPDTESSAIELLMPLESSGLLQSNETSISDEVAESFEAVKSEEHPETFSNEDEKSETTKSTKEMHSTTDLPDEIDLDLSESDSKSDSIEKVDNNEVAGLPVFNFHFHFATRHTLPPRPPNTTPSTTTESKTSTKATTSERTVQPKKEDDLQNRSRKQPAALSDPRFRPISSNMVKIRLGKPPKRIQRAGR